DNRSTIGPQSFGTSCARLTCRSPGTAALGVSIVNGCLAVPDKTPCPTASARDLPRQRSQASRSSRKNSANRQEISFVASALWFCHLLCNARVNVPPSAVRPKKQKRKRRELPRRRPTHGSTRQDAGSRARRQSRLDPAKTHGVTPLADVFRRLHR